MDIFSEHVDPSRDQPRERVVGTGPNPFKVRVEDPYGFWTVHREKGQVPAVLSGQYTTYEKAAQAVDNYIRLNPEKIVGPSSPPTGRPSTVRPVSTVQERV